MAECKECRKKLGIFSNAIDGMCEDCGVRLSHSNSYSLVEQKENEAKRELAQQELDAIILTTETVHNLNIKSRVGIIMADADCSFTVKMVENNNALQSKLRSEAHSIGANAVVGITFNMIETYSATLGVSKVNIFKLIAYGTDVIIEE